MRHISRRIGVLTMSLALALCGCGQGGGGGVEEEALAIRTEYLELEGLEGTVEVTADYGERVYQYGMELHWQKDGESSLTVTAPEEVAGVRVTMEGDETALEYDGARLETGELNAEGLSPVDAVPALLRYAREGFMGECGVETLDETEMIRVDFREPEAQAGTGNECTLWFDRETHCLARGELSVDGFTVIQCVFHQLRLT